MTITACGAKATLTDSEVVAAVRALSMNGTSGPLDFLGTGTECALAEPHPGDCAGLVKMIDSRPGRAWLRWGGARRVERLAACGKGGCELYRGHPGECDPDVAAEWLNDYCPKTDCVRFAGHAAGCLLVSDVTA